MALVNNYAAFNISDSGIGRNSLMKEEDAVVSEQQMKESSRSSAYRIYLLVFAVIAIVVLIIITFIRHRNQKLTAERQEYEYLRYFHSVLPQSNIYGDLKETLAKIERKRKWDSKRYKRPEVIETCFDFGVSSSLSDGLQNSFKLQIEKERTKSADTGDQNCILIGERSPSETNFEMTEAESQLLIDRNAQTAEATLTLCPTIYITVTDENLCSETRL